MGKNYVTIPMGYSSLQFVNIKKQLRLNPCDNLSYHFTFLVHAPLKWPWQDLSGPYTACLSGSTQHICRCSRLTLAAFAIATIGVLR